MQAGRLRLRITLQRYSVTKDAFNADVPSWADIATVSASKADISDAERIASAQTGATVTSRFQVRWSSLVAGLGAKDQVTFAGRKYGVVGVKDLLSAAGAREGLEITAVAKAD